MCTGCHGGGAISSGAPQPDLLVSGPATDRDALLAALTHGAFLRSGMPRVEELTRTDTAAIHAYIRDRARGERQAITPAKRLTANRD